MQELGHSAKVTFHIRIVYKERLRSKMPSLHRLVLSLCLVLMLSTASAFQVPAKSVAMRPAVPWSTQESPSALEMGAVEIISIGAKAALSLPKLIFPTFVKGFAALFVWQMYSTIFKNSLKKGKFAAMEILSEMREDYGNSTKIPEIASKLKEVMYPGTRKSQL